MMRDAEKTIGNLIDKQRVSYIASISEDGFPNMKAMLPPRKRVGICEFYFTTNTSSMRVAQYRKNPNASIYFCDKRFAGWTYGGFRGSRQQRDDLAGGRYDVLPQRCYRPGLLCTEICRPERAVLCQLPFGDV